LSSSNPFLFSENKKPPLPAVKKLFQYKNSYKTSVPGHLKNFSFYSHNTFHKGQKEKSGFPQTWEPAKLLEPIIGFKPTTYSLRKFSRILEMRASRLFTGFEGLSSFLPPNFQGA